MSAQESNCSGRLSIIERYRELLSVDEETPVISLQEGDTPLLRAGNLEAHFEKLTGNAPDIEIWLKYDGANPTGSFKDRGTTMLISALKELGITQVVEDSSGNAGATSARTSERPVT